MLPAEGQYRSVSNGDELRGGGDMFFTYECHFSVQPDNTRNLIWTKPGRRTILAFGHGSIRLCGEGVMI